MRTALRWLAVVVLVAATAACGKSSEHAKPTVDIRKNVKDLSAAEKQEFVGALLKLKATPSKTVPGLNRYDEFVKLHLNAFSCGLRWGDAGAAHNSPLFLPWHREVLLKLQQSLRDVSGHKHLTIPYWDWTDPKSTAAVLSPSFMGGDGDPAQAYAVTTGAFAKGKFKLNVLDPIEARRACWAPTTSPRCRTSSRVTSGAWAASSRRCPHPRTW